MTCHYYNTTRGSPDYSFSSWKLLWYQVGNVIVNAWFLPIFMRKDDHKQYSYVTDNNEYFQLYPKDMLTLYSLSDHSSLSRVRHFVNPWTDPTRLLCPSDSPGKNTGLGCHFLLQGIFQTQGSSLGLLHCRQILYHLSHQGNLCLVWTKGPSNRAS